MHPARSSSCSAVRGVIQRRRWRRSSWVSSTCATGAANKACQNPISDACPSAARAWRWTMPLPAAPMRARARGDRGRDQHDLAAQRGDAAMKSASPRCMRDRDPPAPASRLPPTLSTARRQGGTAARGEGDAVAQPMPQRACASSSSAKSRHVRLAIIAPRARSSGVRPCSLTLSAGGDRRWPAERPPAMMAPPRRWRTSPARSPRGCGRRHSRQPLQQVRQRMASAARPRPKPCTIAPFENCRSRW